MTLEEPNWQHRQHLWITCCICSRLDAAAVVVAVVAVIVVVAIVAAVDVIDAAAVVAVADVVVAVVAVPLLSSAVPFHCGVSSAVPGIRGPVPVESNRKKLANAKKLCCAKLYLNQNNNIMLISNFEALHQ